MLAGGPVAKCPRCQEDNAPGAKYCGACGGRLSGACPACGTLNPATQKFCGECGAALGRDAASAKFASPESYTPRHLAEKILNYRSSLEGERKQVTVLFADVKSSLELLADRDPEDARKLLDAVLKRMMEAVHRYEGTVNQVMGDGIMAIFGAPVAHEDHAVRACYAALRMQRRIARYADRIRRTEGLTVQIRTGLNSGEVVVRSIGNDLHMDYSAVGQTTHLAGRMEQIATPGSILITADTLRLAEGFVQVRSLGGVPIRGLAESVEVYEIMGAGSVRSRLQAAAARGLTRFVGRSAEMEVLRQALDGAGAGQMQVVAVVGEAGVGKSRLLHEFIHSSHTRGWQVLESNSVSYGKATPYLPVIDFLKHYFKIDARDDTRTIREKVTGKVLMLDESLQEAIPPVFDLLDALPEDHSFRALEPMQRRQSTVRAVTRLMQSESRLQPVIAVFEDLHWNDSLSLGLLKGLIANLDSSRLLLLVSYRPDYLDDWKVRPHYRQLRIEPLPRASVEELLQALVGDDPKLSSLKEFLIERTGGNPFFIEEIVRTLVETRVLAGERGAYRIEKAFSSVQVPATVQAVLASRIDRLAPEEKRLLQEAAVIGTDVPIALLRAIAGFSDEQLQLHLANLQAGEFIYETRLFPDLEYTFKHALTHEVAYAGLLHTRRREIHARVVEAIESHYADRITEQVERLAHHARLGEVWRKALLYLRLAGKKAVARPANLEAIALFEQALEVVKQLPENRETHEQAIDLRFDIRNALLPIGKIRTVLPHLEAAGELAEAIGDVRRAGWVAGYTSATCWALGDYPAALDAARRTLALAGTLNDDPLRIYGNIAQSWVCHSLGEYVAGAAHSRQVVDLLQGDRLRERIGIPSMPAVVARTWLVSCLAELGDFQRALPLAEQGIELARELGEPWTLVDAHLGSGIVQLRRGNLELARQILEAGLEICQRFSIDVWFTPIASALGHVYARFRRLPEGLALLRQALEKTESTKIRFYHSLATIWLGDACLRADQTQEAQELAARAMELCSLHNEAGNRAYAELLLGDIAAHPSIAQVERATRHYGEALTRAEALGMQPLMAQCRSALARLGA